MAPLTQQITVKNAYSEAVTRARRVVTACIDFTPKVSVIMPVYNVGKYLRQAVESVLKQTLREIELICVDDGSTDDSVSILREYAAKDSRVTIICQENKFAGVARNAGLAVARGEFLAFLDSDDFFAENMLERACQVAQQEKSDVVYFRYCNYDNETGELSAPRGINIPNPAKQGNIHTCNPDEFAEKRYTMCNPMPWNKLIRASLVRAENICFQGIPASNDVYFSLLLISCARRITLLYEHLVFYRHNRRDSLRNTRDKNPLAFWQAYQLLAETLKQKGLFDKCLLPYLCSLISSCHWTLLNVNEKKQEVRAFIQQQILPAFEEEFKSVQLPPYQDLCYKRLAGPELIISLTSYPGRIGTLHQVIETLLNQSLKADRIILWLAPEQFPNKEADLPAELLEQTKRGLTIDWYHDIRSYKKLIPTLKKYPEAAIMTADDDILYPNHLLRDLYLEYWKYRKEKVLVSPSVSRLYMNAGELYSIGNATLYLDKGSHCHPEVAAPSVYNKLRGGSGTLYPPGSLGEEVMDEERFMTLAPTSDDIWFFVCALKNGYKVKALPTGQHRLNLIPGSQETALWKVNDVPQAGSFTTHLHNLTSGDDALLQRFRDEHDSNMRLLSSLAVGAMRDKLATYRIDVRNVGNSETDVEVQAPTLDVSAPNWLCNAQGRGKMITGSAASARIVLTAKGKGQIRILLRASDYKVRGKSAPVFIDFVRLQINGDNAYSVVTPFNPPHQITLDVNDKQQVVLQLTILPHLYTPLELGALIKDLCPGGNFVRDNMESIVAELNSKALNERLQYLTIGGNAQ